MKCGADSIKNMTQLVPRQKYGVEWVTYKMYNKISHFADELSKEETLFLTKSIK